jgi:hypothetical protein
LDRQSILIGLPKLFIGGKVSGADLAPPPTVNNFAVAENMICERLPFRQKMASTLGPEDESLILNARRLLTEFRSGPSALTQRNTQEPFARKLSLRRRTTIRSSIRPGPRAREQTESKKQAYANSK